MSFFPIPEKSSKKALRKRDVQMLHILQCQACPLTLIKHNDHPSMAPWGAKQPLIYVLGEAPGAEEDEQGKAFVGRTGEFLHNHLEDPKRHKWVRGRVRYNNVVRTRPPLDAKTGNQLPPESVTIECCRPSIVRDIETSKPKAIFGLGGVPLEWATGHTGIFAYRGRSFPVRIGAHTCWYYPLVHPSYILRKERDRRAGDSDDYMSGEDGRMFKFDIESALGEIEDRAEAIVHTSEDALRGNELILTFDDAALDHIEQRLTWFGKQPVIGIDYETNRLRPYAKGAKILSGAVSNGVETISIPFGHPGAGWTKRQYKRLVSIWCKFLRMAKAIKTVHNLQFEMEWTAVKFGYELLRAGKWECTQVQCSILDERYKGSQPRPQTLEFLVLQHFGINIKKLHNVDTSRLETTPLPHVLEYNATDAKYHCLLHMAQTRRIKREDLDFAYRLAVRRVPTLTHSQVKGVPVNQTEVIKLDTKYRKQIYTLKEAIDTDKTAKQFVKRYHKPFDPGTDCLTLFGEMLKRKECWIYDKKKAKNDEKFQGRISDKEEARRHAATLMSEKLQRRVNRQSADEDVLESIGKEVPLANHIINLRKVQKRYSTYILPMLDNQNTIDEKVMWDDGLMHPIFNHTFTDTGRLSSEKPNIQNYPKRQEGAREVRRPIEAKPGHVILAIDYGQIEARVIAMYTKDERFCKALWEDYDIHGEWAQRIASEIPRRVGGKQFLKDAKVMKAFRTDIKNQWTFPLVFGAQCASAAYYLGLDEDELQPLFDEFWEEFDGIKGWQEELKTFYKKHGYVETFTGRRRRGPLSINKIYNAPVQAFTAELVMDGMCRLAETGDPLLHPEIQIHDDLTWVNVPVNKVDYVCEKALDILLYPPFEEINVPITMEVSVGPNWLEMEEIGTFSSHTWRK